MGTEGSSTGSLAGSRSDDLYPDTSQLLQLAQQVAATRGQITDSAENLLQSADEVRITRGVKRVPSSRSATRAYAYALRYFETPKAVLGAVPVMG